MSQSIPMNESDENQPKPDSLQAQIVAYMHEFCDLFDNGTSIQRLNDIIDKNKNLVSKIVDTEHLGFTPKFPFKTRDAILEELRDNQKHLIDALRYEESLLPKPSGP